MIKKELKLTEVQQVLDSSHVYPVINRLIQKKVCFVWEALKQTYSPKKETYVLLNQEYNTEEKLSNLRISFSTNPFNCASDAFDFFSRLVLVTSPSVFIK